MCMIDHLKHINKIYFNYYLTINTKMPLTFHFSLCSSPQLDLELESISWFNTTTRIGTTACTQIKSESSSL